MTTDVRTMADSSDSSSSSLIARARQGDSATLGRLLDRFRGYLRLLAEVQLNSGLRPKIDSSDVVQHTFLDALHAFPQFRGTSEGELVAWLRRILSHNLAGEFRRYRGTQRRDVRLEFSLEQELDASSLALERALAHRDSTPSEKAVRRENAVILADALAQLPDDYRRVIVLRQLRSLSFQEIAVSMGRSSDGVRHLWLRALAALRTQLGTLP